MDDISVYVFKSAKRKHLQLQYRDPLTGKLRTKTAKTSRQSEAEKAAGKWQAELREGRYSAPSKTTWAEFRERYESEALSALADKTAAICSTAFDAFERLIDPKRLRDVTAGQVSRFQQKLRDEEGKTRSEDTIAVYSRHLAAALAWGVGVGMMHVAPKIQRPKRAKGAKAMKGRPITLEEFERMLAKVESVVGGTAAASWKFYLEGLWYSGLRLGEALELYWDRQDRLCVDLSGRRPKLWIPAAMEKGHTDRQLPMAPEFAEFLSCVPEDERHGRVFKLQARRAAVGALGSIWVSAVVSDIGEKAGVKVNIDATTGRVKFASAHDLRRSFGERWASRVMPQTLMELMRHESIETTLRYYVGSNADLTADLLWEAHKKLAPNEAPNIEQGALT